MGNDSGLRKKSKQRTPPHKRHSVYPGLRLSADVKVEYGSIRPINPRQQISSQGSTKTLQRPEIEWAVYDRAAKALTSFDNKSSSRQSNLERLYGLSYKELVKAKLAPKLKRKYTNY